MDYPPPRHTYPLKMDCMFKNKTAVNRKKEHAISMCSTGACLALQYPSLYCVLNIIYQRAVPPHTPHLIHFN